MYSHSPCTPHAAKRHGRAHQSAIAAEHEQKAPLSNMAVRLDFSVGDLDNLDTGENLRVAPGDAGRHMFSGMSEDNTTTNSSGTHHKSSRIPLELPEIHFSGSPLVDLRANPFGTLSAMRRVHRIYRGGRERPGDSECVGESEHDGGSGYRSHPEELTASTNLGAQSMAVYSSFPDSPPRRQAPAPPVGSVSGSTHSPPMPSPGIQNYQHDLRQPIPRAPGGMNFDESLPAIREQLHNREPRDLLAERPEIPRFSNRPSLTRDPGPKSGGHMQPARPSATVPVAQTPRPHAVDTRTVRPNEGIARTPLFAIHPDISSFRFPARRENNPVERTLPKESRFDKFRAYHKALESCGIWPTILALVSIF